MLRDYQQALKAGIYDAWANGAPNVLAVMPTGAGKTVVKAAIAAELQVPSQAIAHRQELVGQISVALAAAGAHHRIIAPSAVVRFCIAQHIEKFGRSYHHAQATVGLGGVDTILRRADDFQQWNNQVRVWDIDEAHHVLEGNKWGKATKLYPNAHGVGFTATPVRADRKALGRTKSGVFDSMVIGPTMRELISRGFLTDYRIFGLPASIDLSKVELSESTGDFKPDQLRREAHKSRITGDIVQSYLRHAPGLRGITFTVDVEMAEETAAAFTAAGVPAAAVSAKTPDHIRALVVRRFAAGELKQLVNVDLFGEGFDVPACEVVSMGRPTQSYGLYVQQFGRALRPFPGKTHGIILDHVENVVRHNGPPDVPRRWSLEDNERQRKPKIDDAMPVTTCTACFFPYEKVTNRCPNCGHVEEPQGRGSPEFVDGDLFEFSPDLLSRLRGEQARIDGPALIPAAIANTPAEGALRRAWGLRQDAQRELRETMAAWAGIGKYVYDRTDSELYRRFFHTFGIDVATAVTLEREQAEKLTQAIRESMT